MKIYFILVSPAIPENVGAVARAMNTMGFFRLRLVNPCNHLHDKALWLAHGSRQILKRAKVFSSLPAALADIDFSVAATARRRHLKHEYHLCDQLPGIFREKWGAVKSAALVFGSEEHGLSNEELKACDLLSSIPMARNYPSLNLSHAVMVYAYLLSGLFGEKKNQARKGGADPGQFRALIEGCEKIFPKIGLRTDSVIYGRVLERMSALGHNDVRLAHFVKRKFEEWMEKKRVD